MPVQKFILKLKNTATAIFLSFNEKEIFILINSW